MKKLILIVIGALVISACANKDVYFNGSEGSHSGMKFDKDPGHWGVNQYLVGEKKRQTVVWLF